jgi:hypothetical protein
MSLLQIASGPRSRRSRRHLARYRYGLAYKACLVVAGGGAAGRAQEQALPHYNTGEAFSSHFRAHRHKPGHI